MRASIVYWKGKSYNMRGKRFVQNRVEIYDDPELIKRCQETAGFSVDILPDKTVRKVKKEVEPVEKDPEG